MIEAASEGAWYHSWPTGILYPTKTLKSSLKNNCKFYTIEPQLRKTVRHVCTNNQSKTVRNFSIFQCTQTKKQVRQFGSTRRSNRGGEQSESNEEYCYFSTLWYPPPTLSSVPFSTGVQFSQDPYLDVQRSNKNTRKQNAVNSLV